MDWQLIGSLALGIVVGYIALYFMTRLDGFTLAGLVTLVGVLVGGTAVEFLADQVGAKEANYGAYSVGLLIGLVLYVILYWIRWGKPPAQAS